MDIAVSVDYWSDLVGPLPLSTSSRIKTPPATGLQQAGEEAAPCARSESAALLNETELLPGVFSSERQESKIRAVPRYYSLEKYLRQFTVGGQRLIELTTVNSVVSFLRQNDDILGRLASPDACPGRNGEVGLVWDNSEHHFSIDIQPNGEVELFYRNRSSGAVWEGDLVSGECLSGEALPFLDRLQ